METSKESFNKKAPSPISWGVLKVASVVAFLFLLLFAALSLYQFSSTQTGSIAVRLFGWLIAANTTQVFWYITRAAGLTGYLLLWLSTIWGLAVSNRILDGMLHGAYTYDFHQFISLLAIGFIFVHVGVLMLDRYLPYNLAQILIPFLSPYRPLWVSVGIFSFYLVLLVTITFYIKNRIGTKTFRAIHVLSLLGFVGAAVHGLFAGTDSPLPAVQVMYAITSLSVVFLTTYWLTLLALKKMQRKTRQFAK